MIILLKYDENNTVCKNIQILIIIISQLMVSLRMTNIDNNLNIIINQIDKISKSDALLTLFGLCCITWLIM